MTLQDARTGGKTRRLSPRDSVARALYIYSGNQCAFTGCPQPLITENGGFVGRIAHIHAASDGGPRANGQLSAEQRREQKNLMLLCAVHAAEIDDVPGQFPAWMLREMKQEHESRFSAGLEALDALIDRGDQEQVTLPPHYFGRTDPEEVDGDREDFKKFIDAFQRVPSETRTFYLLSICRTTSPNLHAGRHRGGEVDHQTLLGFFERLNQQDLERHVRLLEEVELAQWEEVGDQYTGRIEFRAPGEGDLVADLREFLTARTGQERTDTIKRFSALNFTSASESAHT